MSAMSDNAKAISTFGLGTVIAVYLVWFLTTDLKGKMDDHAKEMTALSASFTAFNNQQTNVSVEMLRMTRRICENTSKTDTQREGCR